MTATRPTQKTSTAGSALTSEALPSIDGTPRPRRSAGEASTRSSRSPRRLGWAALIVGLLYAAVSVYWGLGGAWLLDTIGGSLERQGRAGDAGVMLAVWAAVVAKTTAAVLPVIALRGRSKPTRARAARALAWAAAAILTVYGLVLTAAGLLVQGGIIQASATADHRALAWHAYLWDPWFLIWGLLIVAALLRDQSHRRHV